MRGFQRNLGLTPGADLNEVISAVRAEQRRAGRSVRLCCTDVKDCGEGIYRVRVSGFPSLDWSWEGATALRFKKPGRPEILWKGEVVGLEADEGAVYVALDPQATRRPCRGDFVVKPFDFLEALMQVLTEPALRPVHPALQQTLAAARVPARGSERAVPGGLPVPADLWASSWGILWGPPGTGKTYTIGRLVSGLPPGMERVLVVSTTNKATDNAALQIGAQLQMRGRAVDDVVRLGSGSDYEFYRKAGLEALLSGTEAELRVRISKLRRELQRAPDAETRARLQRDLNNLIKALSEAGNLFLSDDKSVVVTTAYGAITRLLSQQCRELFASGSAPFTTVILDEAGLLSCAVTGVLALLAAHRVLLVGDPRQLAPISRMSRILPVAEARWLGSSGLSALSDVSTRQPNVHQLTKQHRMAPAIRQVVSSYQYGGRLSDAPAVTRRPDPRGPLFQGASRAIWYVLDEDPGENLSHIRAVRGPGNRSWMRMRTFALLNRLFDAEPSLKKARGLFISPFAAQAREMQRILTAYRLPHWSASTVHAQQGAEADYVLFDTVNASSTGWPYEEWKRLINVAMTRARSLLYVSSINRHGNGPERDIVETLKTADQLLRGEKPVEKIQVNGIGAISELLEILGHQHHAWLRTIAQQHRLQREPLQRTDGSIVAEPLFWLKASSGYYACFDKPPGTAVMNDLLDAGVRPLQPGEAPAP
jgi:hypothetical protein